MVGSRDKPGSLASASDHRRGQSVAPDWTTLDPRKGLTVWEALYYYVDRETTLRALEFAERRQEAGITSEPNNAIEFRLHAKGITDGTFVTRLVDRLRSGELQARGFASNAPLDAPRQDVHKDRWAELVLDARTSQARGPGVVISSILVFAADGASTLLSRGRKQYSPAQLRNWYVKRLDQLVVAGKRSSRAEDYDDATEAFDATVTKRAVGELRRELAPAAWKRGGRPRSQ